MFWDFIFLFCALFKSLINTIEKKNAAICFLLQLMTNILGHRAPA